MTLDSRHAVQMVMSGFGDKDAEKQPSVQMIDGYAESDETYSIDPALEKRIVRRVDLRILPASMIICFLYFINRSNIGNAEVLNSDTGNSLAQSLHISNKQYLVALMIFFIPYTICETPSNYMLKKFGPSRWFAFIMFGWGAMTMILSATRNFGSFVALRFLLGAFEAGFFPGIIYYLTFWYKPEERAVRIALIIACATLGGAFGGAIAFAVGKMNLARGLEAWRWLFIIEGAPSCAGALLVLFFFPDYPETVPWLSTEEREVAIQRLKGVAPLGHDAITWKDAKATLLDWRLYVHHLIFLAVSVPFSSISLFAPTIVEGLGYEGLNAQLFTVPPYAIAFVVTMIVAWISDRYEMRAWGTFASMLIAGVSYVVEGALPSTAFKMRYIFLCVAVSFSFASHPPSLSWLTANLRSTGAMTLAVPLNVTIAQLGQILGVYIYKSSEAPRFPTGHYTNAAFLLGVALFVPPLWYLYVCRNRALGPAERRWRL